MTEDTSALKLLASALFTEQLLLQHDPQFSRPIYLQATALLHSCTLVLFSNPPSAGLQIIQVPSSPRDPGSVWQGAPVQDLAPTPKLGLLAGTALPSA